MIPGAPPPFRRAGSCLNKVLYHFAIARRMLFRNSLILLVDEDARFRRAFVDYFHRHGMVVLEADDIDMAMSIMQTRHANMVISDWNLPVAEGPNLVERVHALHPLTPVVLLSARADIESQLTAFNSGADDYWVKPLPLSLAVAKCQALLRRSVLRTTTEDPIQLGSAILDLRTRTIARAGHVSQLKEKEYGILRHLALQDGAPLRRETLLGLVWGHDSMPIARTVDNYIVSLRRKLEADPENPEFLITVPGVGYRLLREAKSVK